VQEAERPAGRPPPRVRPGGACTRSRLSGLLFCALCERRVIGSSFNNSRNHYLCTYTADYADTNRLARGRNLYLRGVGSSSL
jgi:site-specific DNA recombinase